MGIKFAPTVSGGGGVPAGDPNALPYYNPAGNNILTDPALIAGALDPFGRPQVHDFRVSGGGRGPVYRLGSWGIDGDPTNTPSEGFVTYGPNALGNGPNNNEGGLGFYTPNSFGVLQIIPGVNGGNPFYSCGYEDGGPAAPFGFPGLAVRDDAFNRIFWVDRATGKVKLIGTGSFTELEAKPAPFVRSVGCTGLQDVPIYGGGNPAPCKLIVGGVHVFIPPGPPPAGQAQAFTLPGGAGFPVTMQGAGWFPGNIPLAGAYGNFIPAGGSCYWYTANPAFWIPGIFLHFLMIPVP
jgi:hypothetical protein